MFPKKRFQDPRLLPQPRNRRGSQVSTSNRETQKASASSTYSYQSPLPTYRWRSNQKSSALANTASQATQPETTPNSQTSTVAKRPQLNSYSKPTTSSVPPKSDFSDTQSAQPNNSNSNSQNSNPYSAFARYERLLALREDMLQKRRQSPQAKATTPSQTRNFQSDSQNSGAFQANSKPRSQAASPNIYTSDYKDRSTRLVSEPKIKFPPVFSLAQHRLPQIAALILFLTTTGLAVFSWHTYQQQNDSQEVAGINTTNSSQSVGAYKKWIQSYDLEQTDTNQDPDKDGLTNEAEFLIKSQPTIKHSCPQEHSEKTDKELVSNLIDPNSCKKIDPSNSKDRKEHKSLIGLYNQIIQKEENVETETEKEPPSKDYELLQLFEAKDYSELNQVNQKQLDQEAKQIDKQEKYLKLINRIDKYIQEYRSYDVFDQKYETPAHPAVYLDVSLKYDVPLPEMLAIARKESRFGTDRFTDQGEFTRPGAHKNIFSYGLDDSGNNITFETWNGSVEAFGKWYQKMEKRGKSDCEKWRIYNHNGDYCKRIQNLASKIEAYLRLD
jgi:hypothetical protein